MSSESEEQTKTMRKYVCMLHSAYFSNVREARKAGGLFGSLELLVKGVSGASDNYLESLDKTDMKTVISDLEKTGLYQDIEVTETGKGYKIRIGKCLFAEGENGVHKQLKPVDVPCIVAYSITQYLAQKNPEKKVYTYPSAYFDEGSETSVNILSLQEYEEKMKSLAKMIKIEKDIETTFNE